MLYDALGFPGNPAPTPTPNPYPNRKPNPDPNPNPNRNPNRNRNPNPNVPLQGGLYDSRSLLHCAASKGHDHLVRELLARGAELALAVTLTHTLTYTCT